MFIRLLIADKHNLFLEGFKNLLAQSKENDFQVVSCNSGRDILNIVAANKIDLIFMDLDLAGSNGLDVIPQIKNISTQTKVCVLTHYSESRFVKQSLQGGADGYCLKTDSFNAIEKHISSLFEGHMVMSSGLRITPNLERKKSLVRKSSFDDGFSLRQKLTAREHEVLMQIVEAKNNKEIGEALYISDQTVGVHRKNIMRKLGVKNTASLIKFALDNTLV